MLLNVKNLVFVLLLASVFISCDKKGDLEINFRATMDDASLVLTDAYNFGDIHVKFENLSFYISDLSIVNNEGESFPLMDVDLIELNAFDQSGADIGKSLTFRDLPSGVYEKLSWTIGVADDLNEKTPSDFNVADPLGRSDHYWENWGSYIFSKTEGNADITGDGIFDLKFFYHTGSDALSRSFELNEEIVISKNQTRIVKFMVDYNDLLKNQDGTYFDIEQFPRNHNPEDLNLISQLVDNYEKAIKFVK